VTQNRFLAHLTGPEISRKLTKDSILVQPVGAIEQHGPHLPLVTDLAVADAVSKAAVDRAAEEGLDVWLLPSLAYTKSNEHAWSAGTIWMSARTMLSVVEDIGRGVATTSCRKLVFMNGHGGNSALLAMANRELRLAYGLQTFLAHPSLPADQGGGSSEHELGMGIHGGHDETSLMLHLHPELVHMDRAVRAIPESFSKNSQVRFGGAIQFGWLSNDFGPDGHIGDPTQASAEHGNHLFHGAVAHFVAGLHEIAAFNP
jgi:creatinine amidohydrolase